MIQKKTKMKLEVIQDCLYRIVDYCKNYSEFLSKSLLNNVTSFFECIGTNKSKKYIDNINGNIDGVLKKVNNEEDYLELIKDLKEIVNIGRKEKIISDGYGKILMNIINTNDIKILVNGFLKEYINLNDDGLRLPKLKKKDNGINLPKENLGWNKELTYAYVGNELYEHMKSSKKGSFIEFNLDSILYEKELYDECVRKGILSLFKDLNKYELNKLSYSEKSRRIYVKSMFKIDLLIRDLDDKNLVSYFDVACSVVDNLYADIHSFYDNKNNIDELMHITRDIYGSRNHLNTYRRKSKLFIRNMDESNEREYYYKESVRILESHKYSMFSFISNVIPLYNDIIKALNNKVIKNIASNVDMYLEHMDVLIPQVCMYMKSSEVVEFYHEFKSVLINLSLKKKMYSKVVILQEKVCNYLSELLEIPTEDVLKFYLKEEKGF